MTFGKMPHSSRPFGVRDLKRAGYRHTDIAKVHRRLKLPPPWTPAECYSVLLQLHVQRGEVAMKAAGYRDG